MQVLWQLPSSQVHQWLLHIDILKKLEFNFPAKADSVIDFLHKQGFHRPHLRKVVSSYPRILLTVDKTLKPKFELLQDLGLSVSDLVRVVMKNPMLLVRNYGPFITACRQVLGSDDAVVRTISSCHWALCPKNVTGNAALLENSYVICIEMIRKHMIRRPQLLAMRTGFFTDLLSRTEEILGIPRHSNMFLYGVLLLSSYSEEGLKSKFQAFEDFGWTQFDITTLMQQNPPVFNSSVARLRKCLDVLMNELGYKPAYLAKNSCFFTYNTEKRVILRHKVLLVLKDKGLIRKNFPLGNAIKFKESVFLDRFVLPFQEAREVYPNFTELRVKLIA